MIFLRHHLHEDLKTEYLTVKDPLMLRNNLKDRYDHQKTVILPRPRYEWVHLRLQDFKSVSEYNPAMFRITFQLTLCGEKITNEEMLEKTFFTFRASNMLLQQQYRKIGRGRGSDRGRGRGFGRGIYHGVQFKNTSGHNKWQDKGKMNEKCQKARSATTNTCYRCESVNHWARACHTAKHLVDFYLQSQKNKGKEVEANFVYDNENVDSLGGHGDHVDPTHLDFRQPTIGSEFKARLKRGRPAGSKDKNPQKKKGANNQDGILEVKETPEGSLEETLDMTVLKETRDINGSSCESTMRKMKLRGSEYVIIAVYVDDLNIIETLGELPKAMECLKKEFEMKDLGKTKFYLGLQIKHLNDGILVHQEAYTKRFCLMSLDLSLNFENEYVALTTAQLQYGGNAINLTCMFKLVINNRYGQICLCYFVEYGCDNNSSPLISINTVYDQVEFKRISLTGFHNCTSRSRYRSVSKQTTRGWSGLPPFQYLRSRKDTIIGVGVVSAVVVVAVGVEELEGDLSSLKTLGDGKKGLYFASGRKLLEPLRPNWGMQRPFMEIAGVEICDRFPFTKSTPSYEI
ncbi:uncharacterized protein Tco_0490971 [Tanacetum coccineum]